MPAASGATAAAAKEIVIVTAIVTAIGTAAAGETGVTATVTATAAPPAALVAGTGDPEGMYHTYGCRLDSMSAVLVVVLVSVVVWCLRTAVWCGCGVVVVLLLFFFKWIDRPSVASIT